MLVYVLYILVLALFLVHWFHSAGANATVLLCGHVVIFRSTPLSRPNRVGLKCPYVRPSTKSFFDFNEIWYVGRG